MSVAISRLHHDDVTEIRLGLSVLLLLRPGRTWPLVLAPHRLHAYRIIAVLHEFRQHPAAIAVLRGYWHHQHLSGAPLADEVLLSAFATAVAQRGLDVLVLPRKRLPVSPAEGPVPPSAGRLPIIAASASATAPAAAAGPSRPVAQWDTRERLAYVFPRAAEDVPGALGDVLRGFATPEGLAGFAVIIGLQAASLAAGGVGLFADAALVGVLWAMCGVAAFQAFGALADFVQHTFDAQTEADLDLAATDLARAAVLLGATALMFLGGWAKTRSVARRVGDSGAAESETAPAPARQRGVTTSQQSGPPPAANRATVSPARRIHILDGDATGGGHRFGTGKPGKSEFPSGWSDDKIIQEVESVANDPASSRSIQPNGRTRAEGTRDGVGIRVIVDPDNVSIRTAHPINQPPNP